MEGGKDRVRKRKRGGVNKTQVRQVKSSLWRETQVGGAVEGGGAGGGCEHWRNTGNKEGKELHFTFKEENVSSSNCNDQYFH